MFFYETGEKVRTGDRIRFHLEPGRIGFVVEPDDKDPEKQWYVQEFGGTAALESQGFAKCFYMPTVTTLGRIWVVSRA